MFLKYVYEEKLNWHKMLTYGYNNDIMNINSVKTNSLKNKLIIILSIFVLLITTFTNVFSYSTTVDDTVLPDYSDIISNYKYWVLLRHQLWDYTYYYLYCTNDNNFIVWISSSGNANLVVSNSSNTSYLNSFCFDGYKYSSSTWQQDINSEGNGKFKIISFDKNITSLNQIDNIIYSNADIYDNTGSVFFQQTPLEVTPTMTLVEILEQEKEQVATLKEVLQILPLIIVVVVCLVGLRKALKILLELLRNS